MMKKIKNNLNKIKEIILLFLIIIFFFSFYLSESYKPSENLKITFFDVGQGDAALIQTPKNIKILIDGGPDNKISNHLGKSFSFFDKNIDIVIATHDDADHIFGLVRILEKYNVKVLFTSLPNSDNPLMQQIITNAKNKNTKIIQIQNFAILKTDDNVLIKFLFPTSNMDKISDGNSASIITQIIYGENKILLTGDLGINGENYLVNLYGEQLQSDILKLGHHGSDTSTGPNFLQKVRPKMAVISAGKNNKFGHPHKTVLDLLNNFKIEFLESAREGNIIFEADGSTIWRE